MLLNVLRILMALIVGLGSPMCCCQSAMLAGGECAKQAVRAAEAEREACCCCKSKRPPPRDQDNSTPCKDQKSPGNCTSCAVCQGSIAPSATVKVVVGDGQLHLDVFSTLVLASAMLPEQAPSAFVLGDGRWHSNPTARGCRDVLRRHCALIV